MSQKEANVRINVRHVEIDVVLIKHADPLKIISTNKFIVLVLLLICYYA